MIEDPRVEVDVDPRRRLRSTTYSLVRWEEHFARFTAWEQQGNELGEEKAQMKAEAAATIDELRGLLEEEERRVRAYLDSLIRAEIPAAYRDHTFETWKGSDMGAAEWDPAQHWSLAVHGEVGIGKTHLATAAYRKQAVKLDPEIADRSEWYSAWNLLREIQQHFGREETDHHPLRRVIGCPLLLIDDLGSERGTEWSASELGAILSERYAWARPTIVTTNLSREQLAAWEPRIADRLFGDGLVITRTGSSWRGDSR